MQLRPYQQENKQAIYDAWDSGVKNVLSVLPCGAGKTVIFSDVLKDHQGASCAIAHRQELVTQISLALARDGVRHKIIGPNNVVKLAVKIHMEELGRSYYDPNAQCAVAGVDTLIRRADQLKRWLPTVTKWVTDECHHLLKPEINKWGKAAAMFPNARGLGVTATPLRADGKGLGRHADGLFDTMIEGPTMRDIINMGYLTDYRIFAPKTEDLNLDDVTVSKTTGDYNPQKLKIAVQKSHVVGDVVKHYLRIAPDKLGITFADNVETATQIAAQFNASGVPAEVVSAKTPDAERVSILRRFRNRELMQLVNVDLFGEGFDLPAISCVSMARPTASYGLYVQQFGRACRLMDGKTEAIIIDHVGNVVRHGLPDAPRVWTLDRREKRNSNKPNDVIPVTSCTNPECCAVYERIHSSCPFCGHKPTPADRAGPEHVDGDLQEIDPLILAQMRGEINRIDGDVYYPQGMPAPTRMRLKRIHGERQEMQSALRESIAWWAGYQRTMGRSDSESHRRFYFMFGIDVMSAQALKRADALALANKINMFLGELK